MSDTPQRKVDAYLNALRHGLLELPQPEVEEILNEIRSHILERAEAGGELSPQGIDAATAALGKPDELASHYLMESLVTRAANSNSPWLIFRTTVRWAMLSACGFASFLVGIIGYTAALVFFSSAIIKLFSPELVGLWLRREPFSLSWGYPRLASQPGQELLGWWFIPWGLIGCAVCVVVTTRSLRWLIRRFGKRSAAESIPELREEKSAATIRS